MNVIFLCKLAGAVIVVSVGIFVSSEYKRSVNGAIAAARDAERLIRYIGESIEYSGDELSRIIASYDGCDPITKDVWARAAETTLSDALESEGLPFDDGTRALLRDFASRLGRGYREPQTELCRIFAGRIARRAESLESSKQDRLRVASAVCVFAALSVIIFFI